MLCLTRMCGQEIVVETPQGNVAIKVLMVNGNRHHGKVKLGLRADKGIPIHRLEIHQKRLEAAKLNGSRPKLWSKTDRVPPVKGG